MEIVNRPLGMSIIVCNFNAKLESILLTLSSCIYQEGVDFEIIYTDDASKNSYKDEITNFFKRHNFPNYKLVCHSSNQGTLKNLIDGIKEAQYTYVKCIGAGDLFYDNSSLKKAMNVFAFNSSDVVIAKSVYFFDDGKQIKEFDLSNPIDSSPYKRGNQKKIQKRLVMNQDVILGASIFARRDYLYELYTKFVGKVKYTEDSLIVYASAMGARVAYLDKYAVMYEYSTGISTSSKSQFQKIIADETESVYETIKAESSDKRIQKYLRIRQKVRSTKGKVSGMIKKFFLTPSQIKIKYKSKTLKKEKADFSFYLKCKEEK